MRRQRCGSRGAAPLREAPAHHSIHSDADLERASKDLATYIGPIAHILVRRAAPEKPHAGRPLSNAGAGNQLSGQSRAVSGLHAARRSAVSRSFRRRNAFWRLTNIRLNDLGERGDFIAAVDGQFGKAHIAGADAIGHADSLRTGRITRKTMAASMPRAKSRSPRSDK
jgi:hypothetical protein